MRRYILLLVLPFIIAACSGNGCGGGDGNFSTQGSQGGGSGSGPSLDSHWTTDIPSQFADSGSSETVPVVIEFASAFTSSDSTAIVSSGGTVTNTDYLGGADYIRVTYSVANLIAFAKSYTGSRIVGLTAQVNGSLSDGSGNGNGPTGC